MKEVLKNKYVLIGIATLLLIMGILLVIQPKKQSYSAMKYEDYTILKGHNGQIEKYDKSHAIEGYKGDGKQAYYISGKITASKDKKFTLITFNLYDRRSRLLGIAVAGLNEVKKGKTYDFKAICLDKINLERIHHYELKNIGNKVVK